MSSQADQELPVSIALEQQHFRLMELPQELLNLLSMPSPPSMQFKSSPSGNVALCLPDKTFQLRQVQTSNSVHIVHPFLDANGDELSNMPGIQAIAQCGSTLEYEATSNGSPLAFLKATLSVYHGLEDDSDPDMPMSKQQIYDDIPFSQAEIDESWRSLCAFESDDGQHAFQPSPKVLLQAWSNVVSAATIEKIDLALPISSGAYATVLAGVENAPENVTRAIFDHIAVLESAHLQLDRQRTVSFVGHALLRASLQAAEVDFMQQWSDLLPESWRADTGLELLDDIRDPNAGTGMVRLQSVRAATQSTDSAAAPAAKRKWHDKFKQARNK